MKRLELIENIRKKKSFLCVGLDPDIKKLPTHLAEKYADNTEEAIFQFNKAIIDATAPYCIAYKPNLAFYECQGLEGWKALDRTVAYIRATHPAQFVIADAKRGDIGNTSRMYARSFFETMDVDALTVSPYMGEDSVTPFLEYAGKWVILLALTSNKGSQDFQFTPDKNGHAMYERVIKRSSHWGSAVNMMYVVGATQGKEIENVRKIAPRHFLLVPGIGAQGGSLEEVARYGMIDECGLIVNSSRGIIYASNGEDFAEAAGRAARDVQEEMSALLEQNGII